MTDCPPPPAIECRGLRKSFGGGLVRALDNVSLAIRSREFFTLLGPSGCGKSTLLRMIGGFEQPDHGSILLDGEPLDGLPPYRRPVNTVFQSYAVFPHMTVAGNIAFGLQMRGRSRAEIARRVGEMLALVKLDGLGGRKPSQLSGGQQQRVALARALAGEPRVLLLDEPLSALDRKLRAEMQAELKRLQAVVGITFIFVTHDQTEALAMSDRIAVMHAGRILQVGTPRDIYEHPATRFVAEFIGETNLLDAVRIGPGRFRLSCGVELAGADAPPGGPAEVTLAIRPERAILSCEPDMGDLTASVERLVYLGTDLAYELRLPDGRAFRVREQNRGGVNARTEPGARVALRIPPEAIHVLDE